MINSDGPPVLAGAYLSAAALAVLYFGVQACAPDAEVRDRSTETMEVRAVILSDGKGYYARWGDTDYYLRNYRLVLRCGADGEALLRKAADDVYGRATLRGWLLDEDHFVVDRVTP